MEKCLICQKETKPLIHPKTSMIFHKCSFCGAIFKDSSHYPNYEDEKNRYLEHHNEITNQGYVTFLEKFMNEAVKPFMTSGHILDFGSGPNPVLKWILDQNGFQTDYYDPFFQIEKPKTDQKYHMITATEVMEHVQNPLDVLRWMDHHTMPNGYIALMTLFYPNNEADFFKWFYLRDITHIVFYTTKTFKKIAEIMHWDLVKCDDYRIAVFQKRG